MRAVALLAALAVLLVPTAAADAASTEPCDPIRIYTSPPDVVIEPRCLPDSPEDVIRIVEELLP